jgi:glycolate oxidase
METVSASRLHERLSDALGAEAVKTAPEDLAVYAFDAYSEAHLPSAAVLPSDARDVSAVVRIARECGEPLVARGAGTGLCGGAVPVAGGIVLSFARMNRVLSLDARNRRARVQPGLINLDLSKAAGPLGLFFGPDPSSQKISTIGGNVGTNAGGPHALSYGSMTSHVLGLEFVDERGEVVHTSLDDPGYDLTGALVGSEGTLGIVTAVDLRLLRVPRAIRVCVAAFGDVESASGAVSAIIAAGIVPTALEIMDRLITQAVEAHYHAGFPLDAGARTARSRGARLPTRASATLSGPRAKARPVRSAASRRTTTSKTRACRARVCPKPCTASTRSPRRTVCRSATSSTRATATCTRS